MWQSVALATVLIDHKCPPYSRKQLLNSRIYQIASHVLAMTKCGFCLQKYLNTDQVIN